VGDQRSDAGPRAGTARREWTLGEMYYFAGENPDLYGFLPGIKEGVALPQIQITFTGTKMDARYFVFHVYTMFFLG